jgi:hypothetical protein
VTDILALGDAVPAIKAVLTAFWGAAARIADELPADWTPQNNPLPVIAVNDDGGPVTWPLWARTVIRITVHADGKQTAKQVRAKTLGALMGATIPGVYLPAGSPNNGGIGYTEARDSNTGADMASFTVAATVCTQTVTA